MVSFILKLALSTRLQRHLLITRSQVRVLRVQKLTIGSLSKCRSKCVFETRTATGSELFSLLPCLHTTTFISLSIFALLEALSLKIWERPLSWRAKYSLPVAVRVSKTGVLKLPNRGFARQPCCMAGTMKMFCITNWG